MRLLLDAAFPTAAEGLSRPGLIIERWSGGDVTDLEFIENADRDGFTGVAFVGLQALGRKDVLTAAAERHLLVIVTTADDPFKAQRDLSEYLPAFAKEARKGLTLVISSQGGNWRPPERTSR